MASCSKELSQAEIIQYHTTWLSQHHILVLENSMLRIKPIARLILSAKFLESHTISDQSLLLSTTILNDYGPPGTGKSTTVSTVSENIS